MTSLTVSTAISSGRVRLVSHRQEALLTARIRVLLVAAGFAVLATIALLRIFFLGIGGGNEGPASLAEALLPQSAGRDAVMQAGMVEAVGIDQGLAQQLRERRQDGGVGLALQAQIDH